MTPQELGEKADEFFNKKTERLAADKVAKALKEEESTLEALLISELRAASITSIGGKKVKASIPVEPDYVPAVNDWAKVQAEIIATGDFSLLEKRIGRAAVKERWENGETVPGVEKFPVYKLSIEKVKK